MSEMNNAESAKARQYETTLVLANAVQLSTNVIRSIAGNDIADGVGGEPMTRTELADTLAAKIGGYLMNPTETQK